MLIRDIAKLIAEHPGTGSCAPDCLCTTLLETFPAIRKEWEALTRRRWEVQCEAAPVAVENVTQIGVRILRRVR